MEVSPAPTVCWFVLILLGKEIRYFENLLIVIKIPRIQEILIELDSQNIWEGIKKKREESFIFVPMIIKVHFFMYQ